MRLLAELQETERKAAERQRELEARKIGLHEKLKEDEEAMMASRVLLDREREREHVVRLEALKKRDEVSINQGPWNASESWCRVGHHELRHPDSPRVIL